MAKGFTVFTDASVCKVDVYKIMNRRHENWPVILLYHDMHFPEQSYSGRGRYDSYSPPRRYRSPSRSNSRSRSRSRSRESDDVQNPGNNLYVTGLSPRITKRELEDHFSREGTVIECHLVVDPRTRESRGFGFVTMKTVEDADRCIKYLNRSVVEGRVITVEKAKRKRGRTPTPGKYLGVNDSRHTKFMWYHFHVQFVIMIDDGVTVDPVMHMVHVAPQAILPTGETAMVRLGILPPMMIEGMDEIGPRPLTMVRDTGHHPHMAGDIGHRPHIGDERGRCHLNIHHITALGEAILTGPDTDQGPGPSVHMMIRYTAFGGGLLHWVASIWFQCFWQLCKLSPSKIPSYVCSKNLQRFRINSPTIAQPYE
eukprot:Gb_38929 [translate_table: standard]